MTNTGKNIVAIVATYIVIRIAYWFLHFNPTDELPRYIGFAVDIAAWVGLYLAILWFLNKAFPAKSGMR